MSLLGEAPTETRQREVEVQEDEEPVSEGKSDDGVRTEEFLEASPGGKRALGPLIMLKDDFNQFKEEIQRKLKEMEANAKANKFSEKQARPPTLLKEDLNQLRENLAGVFRFGVPKNHERKGEPARAESADEPFGSPFGRERALPKSRQEVHKSNIGRDFRGLLTKRNTEKRSGTKNHEREPKNIEMSVIEPEITGITQTQHREAFTSKTGQTLQAAQTREAEGWSEDASVVSEDDGPSAGLSSETLNSGIDLFTLGKNRRNQPTDDLWSPKNFATYLTLDPNTASAELRLSDGNRRAVRDWLNPWPSEHPDRFEGSPQVLCREGLLDSVYWEVEWSGGADVGVTCSRTSRDPRSCLLGHSRWSWSLECAEGSYTPCHDNKRFGSSSPEPFTRRVGVFINRPEESLSFYCISKEAMVHLHTFGCSFTEPLYPGFWVWSSDGSVSLCQVELDWERLLQ